MIKYGEINSNINNKTPVTFLIKYVTHEHKMYKKNFFGKNMNIAGGLFDHKHTDKKIVN